MTVMETCPASLQPSAPHRHRDSDPEFTARCPSCGHAVEIAPLEPGETEGVWRFAYHDLEGYTLVQHPRGAVPWKERVIDPGDL